jgi:hypothetical protein
MNPKYPIYIISKGRAESRKTSRALEKIMVPYKIVIEPQEFKDYSKYISPKKILILPFSNLGQGSIPARNWVWNHAVKSGTKRHWILDDNIRGFYRLNKNMKVKCESGTIFKCAEDFTDRYLNVPMSGLNYFMFAPARDRLPPFYLNTRVYSCILLDNSDQYKPIRWRGRYNEDTDLSIRFLKAGYCTILFNAFLAYKETTMTMTGGNSDKLYKKDGRLQMAQSLWRQYQNHVNYRPFKKNKLIKKSELIFKDRVNNYGMKLIDKNKNDQTVKDYKYYTRYFTYQKKQLSFFK